MTDSTGWERKVLLALLVVGILLFTLATTYMNWVKYVSLRSTWAYDLGFFNNSAFNYAQGRTTTYIRIFSWIDPREHKGPSIFRIDHFSPMALFLIPQLYRVWPHIGTLMFLQSLLIGLGAIPLYLFGSRRTGEPRLGFLLALSYLLHPAILHTAFNDFREIQVGLPLALFALWFHADRRPWPFLVAAVLMLACRPEYIFMLGLFGLINLRAISPGEGKIRWLLAPLVPAALWAVLTNAYYLSAYGRPWPLLGHAVAGKGSEQLIANLLDRLPAFFRITLLPGALGLLAPEAWVVALPFVATAGSVRWPAFPHHDLQHISPAIAVVFWAFACGVVRLWPRISQDRPRVRWAHGLLVAAALLSGVHFGWGAVRTYLGDGFPRDEVISRIDEALPTDATIMVPKSLVARFSHHTRVFTHQALLLGTESRPPVSEMVRIFAELISICDLIVTEAGEEWLGQMVERSDRYLPAQMVNRYRIFVAKPDAPRPPNPDKRLQEILRWDQMSATKRVWADILAE
jgi:hypothetical protein